MRWQHKGRTHSSPILLSVRVVCYEIMESVRWSESAYFVRLFFSLSLFLSLSVESTTCDGLIIVEHYTQQIR